MNTSLEFLYPYLRSGYITDIDYKTLKSYIKNPSTLAYKNWKEKIFDIVKTSRGHLSCPIYTDPDYGVHNPISFSDECVLELSSYFIDIEDKKYVECIRESLTKIVNSNKLKIKYGLPVKTEVVDYKDFTDNPNIVRDTLWEYIHYMYNDKKV